MNRKKQARGGYALTTAILMIGFVAAATMAVTGLLSVDGRRTFGSVQEAQLRQLLTAGALDAQARLLNSESATSWTLSLPPELVAESDASVEVSISPVPDAPDARDVHVRALLGGRPLSQTVRFHHTAGRWNAVEAHLGR